MRECPEGWEGFAYCLVPGREGELFSETRFFEEAARFPEGTDSFVGKRSGHLARAPNELEVDLVVMKLECYAYGEGYHLDIRSLVPY